MRTDGGTGSVLVQRMVDAEYSGVLFTRDPSAGGLAMVEMVQGTAENLVSGSARPQTYRFGRISKKSFGKASAPIDLSPLLVLGDQAESSVRRSAGHRMGLSRWRVSTSCRAVTSRAL